jgi:IS5 family transposase
MERKFEQPTFIDAAAVELGGPRTTAFLDKCERLIPWDDLAASLSDVFSKTQAGNSATPGRSGSATNRAETPGVNRGGRPHWPVRLYLKCMMLQKWFGLSDPQLEEQLRDRISFRRFVGLTMTEATPDETSMVRFRERLRDRGHERTLFEAVGKHLEKRNLVLHSGTLVDATIVEAPRGRKREDGTSTRDTGASYTKKNDRTYHGYKGHVATDRNGLVKDFRFNTAKHHDSQYIDALTKDEKTLIVGDSAYMSQEREARLSGRGVCFGVVKRRVRGQEGLSYVQQLLNRAWSTVRAVVEHPFAWMRNMGYRKVRYRGLVRNALDFGLMAAAYNLKRSFSLLAG